MKLGIYSYFNKALNAFDVKFQMDDHSEEQVVFNVQRAVTARCVLGTQMDLKFLAFYKLGTFDDETGDFVADKKLLLDLDNVIASWECKQVRPQEVKENGSECSSN